jgi:hypothetical protein
MVHHYAEFCAKNDWHPVPPITVQRQLPELMNEIHSIGKSHDIKGDTGIQRGFKGVQIDISL